MPGGYHGRAFLFFEMPHKQWRKNCIGSGALWFYYENQYKSLLNQIIQMKNEFIVVHQMQYKFLLNQIIEMKNEFIAVHQRLGEIVSAWK
jgi:hypothetical protein